MKPIKMIDIEIARLETIRDCSVAYDMLPPICVLVEFVRKLGVPILPCPIIRQGESDE